GGTKRPRRAGRGQLRLFDGRRPRRHGRPSRRAQGQSRHPGVLPGRRRGAHQLPGGQALPPAQALAGVVPGGPPRGASPRPPAGARTGRLSNGDSPPGRRGAMYRMVSDDVFKAFLAQVYPRVPAVRRLLEEAGLTLDAVGPPEAVLPRLRITAKDELSRQQQADPPFGGWVAGGLEGVRRVFVSPGPIHNIEGLQADDWGAGEAFRAAGFGPGDLVLNTFTYHLSPAAFMMEAGVFAVGAAVVPAGTMSRSEQARVL